jgi:hypothetical protein
MMVSGRTIAAAALAATLLVASNAQAAPVSYTGGTYTENFDSLGWRPDGKPIGTDRWADDSTFSGWYAASTSSLYYLRGSNGSSVLQPSLSLYSYGTSDADNAFGTQNGIPDWIVLIIYYGVRIVNNTGHILNEFTLSYFAEQWRDDGNGLVEWVYFHYGLGAPSLTSGDYTRVMGLDMTTPIHGLTETALDGNLAANRTLRSRTVSGIQWLPEESLWLRWMDVDDMGLWANSALAVDDLVFTAKGPSFPAEVVPPQPTESAAIPAPDPVTVPQPNIAAAIPEPNTAALAALSMLALGMLVRRTSAQRG